ncbi:LAFA_0D02850g1_1 [Lachancea sp. 'fantastica']|nr:LAFA_0D02850g1_1 [Lachancea sp. 'fantastica']
MLQLITSPAMTNPALAWFSLLVSTVIPLQFTIEYLNMSGSGPEPTPLSILLLKFWCLHAMTRVIPNPLVYVFQSLPLSNVIELGAWLVLTRELVSQFGKLEIAKGYRVESKGKPPSQDQRFLWTSYFMSISNRPPTDRYVFGQLTFYSLAVIERWPLDLQVLDSSFRTVMGWISQLRSKAPPQTPVQTSAWTWGYNWFAGQTNQTSKSEEEYDLLEDVIQDIKRS